MDQVHHQIFEKIAQDSGSPEASAPGFVTGLSPQDEWLIRKRTEAAAKMRHLPPELAYALTGEMPITDSPAANIELHRALERASSRGRSKLVGLGYGLPAAAAGAVLGHVLGQGDPAATIGGGLAAGGGVGYLAHRGEREGQRRLGGQLAQLRTQYQMAQQQAMQQQEEALQELAQAQALEQQNAMMRQRSRKRRGQRKAAQAVESTTSTPIPSQAQAARTTFPGASPQTTGGEKEGQANFNEAMMARFKRRTKKGLPKVGQAMDFHESYNAADSRRTPQPKTPWATEKDSDMVQAESPTYIGRFGGEKYGSVDEAIQGDVRSVLAHMRELEKAGQGIQTGNQMGVGGSGAMKPPSPSGGGMGSAAQAPRMTASPTAAGMAPKPPPGLSGQSTTVQSQPKFKPDKLGPGSNAASGAPPTVPAQQFGAGGALPPGLTTV